MKVRMKSTGQIVEFDEVFEVVKEWRDVTHECTISDRYIWHVINGEKFDVMGRLPGSRTTAGPQYRIQQLVLEVPVIVKIGEGDLAPQQAISRVFRIELDAASAKVDPNASNTQN